MKSKSKTKTNMTTTPQAPDWIKAPVQDFTGKVQNFMNSDPTQYVAPASELQNKAFGDVKNLGSWKGAANTALNYAQQGASQDPSFMRPVNDAQAQSLLQNFNQYLDPATEQLVNAALAKYDADTGRQAAALKAQGAKAGAFGGSRFGLAEGAFQAEAGRNRALTDAELRSNAFRQAAQLSSDDAARRQQTNLFNTGMAADREQFNANAREQAIQRMMQAAGIATNVANVQGANQRADVALTGELGAMQRAIDEAQRNAVPTQLQLGGALLGSIPYNAFVGQNTQGVQKTTSSPGVGNVLAGLGGMALGGWASGGVAPIRF
jgi:hypothetical protein